MFVVCTSGSIAQEWPGKILGYKTYDAKISISNSDILQTNNSDAFVRLTDPTLADIGFSGATIEIGASVTSTKESGSIDFVTFRDVFVNGLKVDVDDYKHAFSFKNGETAILPRPARITLKASSLPRAAYNELVNSKSKLSVTGTAFVFGKFKKMGFSFRRVVPVRIDLKLKNPLR
ncbi:MAG TPA: hypothetical protein PLP21_08090 [Pyrinomonadaceae bacterium]|nr:hypothetical protein [Acidobacteriota bacterium]HQZ96267.1 hypothetical protein [Pyrinomonadaceae bacterium]